GRWVAYKDVQRFEGALSGVNEEVAVGIMVARSKRSLFFKINIQS
ncbi:9873_t:CDS:2, partial [Paraglomus occultum]